MAARRTRTPVTGARLIGGLTPCNVIPDEILTDHPKRFRAMLVESGNPAHSLADSARMREAIAPLELVVVIDVAFTETARLAHYVLPVASQFEKAEATFFNFEFPHNYFHLRKPLAAAAAGPVLRGRAARAAARSARRVAGRRDRRAACRVARRPAGPSARSSSSSRRGPRRLLAIAPALLYRAIGDLLPDGSRRGRGRLGPLPDRSAAPSDAPSRARASPASPARPPTRSSTPC